MHVLALEDIVTFEYFNCSTRIQTVSVSILSQNGVEFPLNLFVNCDSDFLLEYKMPMRCEGCNKKLS